MNTTAASRALPGLVLRTSSGRLSLRLHLRSLLVCGILTLAGAVVAILSVATGDYPISAGEAVRTLLGAGRPEATFIVEELRLPRVLDALLVGAALGVAGAVFQSLTRNPLGSPEVIGFTQGAAAGAVLEIAVFGGGTLAIAAGAVGGGLATAIAVYALAFEGGAQGYRLVLVGIGFSALLASLTAYLITKADLDTAQAARVWLVGNLNGRGWEHVGPVAASLLLLLPTVAVLSRRLRLMELGDDAAGALGIDVERSRLLLVVVAVCLTAVAVASAGPIAFVALAAPQLARRLTQATGPGLAGAACMGSVLLMLSDFAAQRIFPATPLPVGVLTGVVGGVYLIGLLVSEWRHPRR